jgi:hypothetical protein
MAQVGDVVWVYYGNFNGGFYCDVFTNEADAYAEAYRDMLDAATLSEALERRLRSGKVPGLGLENFMTYYADGEDALDVYAAFYSLSEATKRSLFGRVLSASEDFDVYIERTTIA